MKEKIFLVSPIFKKTAVLVLAPILTTLLIQEQILAAKLNFRIYNQTKKTIIKLYISDSSSNNWTGNILGKTVLAPNSSIQVQFSDHSSTCFYDIRAVFADSTTSEEYRVNACVLDEYAFIER